MTPYIGYLPRDGAAEPRTERVNPKRMYRVMRRNKLLLYRYTGDGRGAKARRCYRHTQARLGLVLGRSSQ